jgi:hypothetical protein
LPTVRAYVHHGSAIEPGKYPFMLYPGRNAVAEHLGPVIWQIDNRGKLFAIHNDLRPSPPTR